MKLTFYGIAFVALFIGSFGLPTKLEISKYEDSTKILPEKTDGKESRNVNDEKKILMALEELPKLDETPKTEEITKTDVKFPQNNKEASLSKDVELEMMPRLLESTALPDKKEVKQSENKSEQTLKVNKEEKLELPTKNVVVPQKVGDHPVQPLAVKDNVNLPQFPKEAIASAQEISVDGFSWKEFEDTFSLLEDRLPDLTEEHIEEINKEDSIPLTYLKSFDISKEQFRSEQAKPVGKPLAKSEPAVHITIPIVINSHSTLPISLKLGGQVLPLDMFNMLPSSRDQVLTTPLKTKAYNQPSPRETNRHRNNLRTKIYARNKNHEVFAYDV